MIGIIPAIRPVGRLLARTAFGPRAEKPNFSCATALLCLAVILTAPACHAAIETRDGAVTLSSPSGDVRFSTANGSILAATPKGATSSVWQSGESGLWAARFADDATLDAARFHATNAVNAFSWKPGPDTNSLALTYISSALTVRITARPKPDGIELAAEITPASQPLLRIDLPGRLRFAPGSVTRFVMPHNGGVGVGAAFNQKFFEPQPNDHPSGWMPTTVGPGGYRAIYGGPLDQRPTHDPPVNLTITDEGRRWLPPAVASRIVAAKAVVNRPPTRAQADTILIDSPNGPYFSGNHLGGNGYLWRIGGGVGKDDVATALTLVSAAVDRLATTAPNGRARIGLVSLMSGPERGNWAEVPIADWRARLSATAARSRGRVTFTELASPQAMLAATRQSDFLCILNPYGEGIPADSDAGLSDVINSIRAYVKAGGNWFEVGGYPFHQVLRPLRYLSYETAYPVAFSDFLHLESRAGTAALYRIQPRTVKQPWNAASQHDAIFIPGSLGCGGDEHGGYCDHAYGTYVRPGETWRPPAVRMTLGTPVYEDLARYCAANGLTRPLAAKLKPDTLARLRRSVLVYLIGPCPDKASALDRLPVPTLIHFADYLRGGFDKQYPDHLPPKPDFGTPEEFRAFFDRAHALGHLISPYTNPTWWCDHPKGPTFEREGDAPLLKTLDGKPHYEKYEKNDGWTITLWHPAVQAANRLTVRQFTREYPVDILFQDQCGARSWLYDTNPASPTPYAYSEGMIAMVDEDSRTVPLGTENGWDRVANYETLLCGMSWGIVPTEHRPSWVRLFKAKYPPETWTIFPLAQAIAHDKTVLLHHDLGQFITNDQVLSWSLGLGYSLSYRLAAAGLAQDVPREWLAWLDRLQKSVCARYIGEPLADFSHDRAPLFAAGGDPRREDDDGVIRATYGPVRIVANLGPVPRTVDAHALAPFGFHASSPGMSAGLLAGTNADGSPSRTAFVTETAKDKADIWVYAPSLCSVAVPSPFSGRVRVMLDGAQPIITDVADSHIALALPAHDEKPRVLPPPSIKDLAPHDWPGPKPAIGIIDLGPGISPASTAIRPADWHAAFEASALAKQHGVTVKTLSRYQDIAAALAAGPQAWFAIINPYGEFIPAPDAGRWRETLDAIRSYVNNGGSWWETAAYPFYQPVYRADGGWKIDHCGPAGAAALTIPVGDGEVNAPPDTLHATEIGRAWLGEALAAKIEKSLSAVNRGVPSTESAPATVLVAGASNGFIGGYRLGGWGYLWRVGGFNPNPDVVVPVAVAATLHQYTHPIAPPLPSGARYLWHAQVHPEPRSLWERLRRRL